MGTSTSHPSPKTPNWLAVQTAYSDRSVSIERAVQEIWRAASNQSEQTLVDDLAGAAVARCLDAVAGPASRDVTVETVARVMASSGQASLALEIARRAVTLSFGTDQERTLAFRAHLFAEATNYLVSRDLPGYVGTIGRAHNVSQALEFKEAVLQRAERVVRSVEQPKERGHRAWETYVRSVVERLRGEEPNAK